MSTSVQEVMTRNPKTLKATAKAIEAARIMRDDNIGDVLVTRSDGTLCGVATDRDLVVRLLAKERDPNEVEIDDVCSHDVASLGPDSTIEEAVEMMKKRAVRRLPVTENGKPIGIVSIGDLAAARDRHSALGEISAAPPNL